MKTNNGASLLTTFIRAAAVMAISASTFGVLASPIDSGFEAGTIGLPPDPPWQYQAADGVEVVGSEGPADFSVYAEMNITVTPFRGAQALRLGTPKQVSESQNSGANRVYQTFPSTSSSLRFSLYLFSFEHRGDDSVVISVSDPYGAELNAAIHEVGQNDLTISNPPRGRTVSCDTTPCELVLDVGKRNDFLNTGWREIELTGLPDDGSEITLSINVQGANNEAHGTWGYLDNTNSPPQADFSYNPGRAGLAGEGDYIVVDASGSSDPDGDELTYSWTATGGGLPGPAAASGSSALFVFPDAPSGNPQITLTVSDGTTTATAQTGAGSIAPISLSNVPPFIAALDTEVLSGGSTELICRFIDPGVLDSHTGDLSVTDGSLLLLPVEEEQLAPFSSGRVRGIFTAPVLSSGELVREITGNVCAITDDAETTTDEFEIRVLDREEIVNRYEPNNSTGEAAILRAGSSYLGALETPSDIDVFEIRLANGDPLPVKSQVSVRLNVPADFDLLALGRSTSTLAGSPILASPLLASPWLASPLLASPILASPILASPLLASPILASPLLASPILASPWLASPLLASPILASPILASGLAMEQFPLQQLLTATPDGSNISATDTSWLEVGSLIAGNLANENVEIKALSAEPNLNPEHIYVEVGPGDESIFIAVTGTNGSFSSAPYSVSVEVAVPFSQADLLGPAQCTRAEPLVPAGIAERTLNFASGDPTSLVVIQYERFAEIWGLEDTAEAFFEQMRGYLSHPAVNARVLLLSSDLFVPGDLSPCSVAAQNEVASSVKARIQQYLDNENSIENIVLVGGYDVLTPYYVIDESIATYEGLYGADLWIQPNTPLSAAINEGYNPTDAFYASSTPLAYRGRQLFIKDTPIGRLVETPQQILATTQTFVDQDGLIPSLSGLAMGYDFFNDGTNATADVLEEFASTRRLTTDNIDTVDQWNASTMRCEFLGESASPSETCTIADVRAVNAHMSYNLAAPAAEYAANNFLQSPTSLVRATEAQGKLGGGLDISIGCHSALNVPNNWALPGDGYPADTGFDWSETGVRMGPVGFGSGDTEVANRGTEGIVTLIVEELAKGHTLGEAEVIAVQRYLNGLFEIDVHDEDAIVTFSLNGPPQARLANPAAAAPVAAALAASSSAGTAYGALTLDISRDGSPLPISTHAVEQVAVANGVYYTSDGQAQAIMGRPLLPVQTPPGFDFVPVNKDPDESWLHGVLLLGGDFEDLPDLDPVISSRAQDWARAVNELQICVETRSPTQLAAVSTLRAGNDNHQTLVVNPAQFQCTLTPQQQSAGDDVTGEFRLFSNLVLDALSPPAGASAVVLADFTPPTVQTQDISATVTSTDVTANLEAHDVNGVRSIVGLVYNDDDGIPGGSGNVISVVADCGGAVSCARTLTLPDARGKLLAFQYADVAGNVLMKSLKGLLIEALEVNIRTRSFTTGDLTTIVVEVENYAGLASGTLAIDYGDGTSDVFALDELGPVTINPDGFGVIEIDHSYSNFPGSEVTVIVTVRASGAIGTDTETLTRPFDCDANDAGISPDADIVSCDFSSIGTEVTLDMFVEGTVTDVFQYRLTLQSLSGQFKINDLTKVTKPGGVTLLEPPLLGPANRVRFRFDAASLGWDGSSPITYLWETQDGVKGKKGQGFIDEAGPLTSQP